MITSIKKHTIITLSILGLFFICASFMDFRLVETGNQNEITPKTSDSWDLTGTLISIDNNWSLTESTYDWCSGAGTANNPYVIENVTLDAQGAGNCITVLNSVDYFEIRNCTLSGAPTQKAAIWLDAANNSKIIDNNISNTVYYGIYTWNCEKITVAHNIMTNNDYTVIWSMFSNQVEIANNSMTNQDRGIYIGFGDSYNITDNKIFYSENNPIYAYNAFSFNVSNNIVHYYPTQTGFSLDIDNSTIDSNRATTGHHGMVVRGDYNNITNNLCKNNTYYGLSVAQSTYCNVISNMLTDNFEGLFFNRGPNMIYLNYFYNNTENARDDIFGNNNTWDNGTIGNYYDDYGGKDQDDDGIGDTPYTLMGTALHQDNLPIWWDSPVLSINSPSSGQTFYDSPPNFNIEIEEGVADAKWYTLGTAPEKHFFATNGSIDSTAWTNLGEGNVDLNFFVNDSRGLIANEEVTVARYYPTPPHSFTLSSDATNPDDNGDFTLTWAESAYADNYTVYQSSSYITAITGSLTPLVTETTDTSLSLTGYATGAYYFIVVSYNMFGTNISNCIEITVSISDSDPEPSPAIPSFDMWFIAISSVITLVSLIRYRRKLRLAK